MVAAQRLAGTHHLELAEIAAEPLLVVLAEGLPGDHDDGVLEQRALDLAEGFGIERAAQIDALDPGPDRLGKRADGDWHGISPMLLRALEHGAD